MHGDTVSGATLGQLRRACNSHVAGTAASQLAEVAYIIPAQPIALHLLHEFTALVPFVFASVAVVAPPGEGLIQKEREREREIER
jgi:hypothetical protein